MEEVKADQKAEETAKPADPKVFLYVAKAPTGEINFQIGGHDAEVLGLIEFAKFFMNKKLTDQLKFEQKMQEKATPKAVQ
jgi:hypothetical protein